MKFIDIHGHYAWGIDDGMPSYEDAVKAIDKAKANHIVGIIATPHLVCGKHDRAHVEKLRNRINDFKELAKSKDIVVFSGCELFLNDEYYEQISNHLIIPIENTDYLLCEFDVRKNHHSHEEFEDRLYEVRQAGYKVVIAHIERYFRNIDLDRIEDLVDQGFVVQINSTSILGVHGKTVQNNAYELLRHNLVHCIATDTHRPDGSRSPNLLETYNVLKKEFSEEDLNKLMYKNPLHLLKNEEVEKTEYKKKGFISKLFGGK